MIESEDSSGEHGAPPMDLAEKLVYIIGDTAVVQEHLGGFRFRITHGRGFPWSDVCMLLAVRGFKVYVTLHKSELHLEASL